MKVLLIDNYDSFTFNIVELLRQLKIEEIAISKNDEVLIQDAIQYDKIIISPGPATPKESGNILEIIEALAPTHSILGICLGHQAIAEVFGAGLQNLNLPFHGYQTDINPVKDGSTKKNIFRGITSPIKVGLYHSWTVSETNFPACLEITSYSKENHIMSLRHKEYDVLGVQFHPESYMTEFGNKMMENWLWE